MMCGPLQIRVKKLHERARLPCPAHEGDVGLDLFACQAAEIQPGERVLVATGIAIELPPGTEAQVRPRSGLALKHGITVLNTPGTIDAGYRGEVGVILINHGDTPYRVSEGARIAQLVVKPVLAVRVIEQPRLSHTDRGTGGFGSTG